MSDLMFISEITADASRRLRLKAALSKESMYVEILYAIYIKLP